MNKKNKMKAIIAIAVAMAFIMPITAVANVGTIGITPDVEDTSDIEIMAESTNSDNSDNTEYTIATEETVDNAMPTTGNIIYVGGSGAGNYTTIQLGINAAQIGDTVYVYDGLYLERITISKQLDLIGESRENTIIDGGGPGWYNVVYVTASGVNVSDFTVQGLQGYAFKYYKVTGGTIKNCNATSRKYAVWLYKAMGTSVINCNLIGSTDDRESGIYVQWSDNCNIEGCNIYNHEKNGILNDQNSDGTTITNCKMYNNSWNGILIDGSSWMSPLNIEIIGCDIYNNDDSGIFLNYAVTCTLDDNTIYDNPYGFSIVGSIPSHYNHAIGPLNTVNGEPIYWLQNEVGTTYDGINFGFLALISCTDVTVMNADTCGMVLANTKDSTISNVNSHNAKYGIDIQVGSSNNDIINCNFYNVGKGVNQYLCSHNDFTNCNAYDSEVAGFSITKGSYNTFTNCNASDNSHGFSLSGSSYNTFTNCGAYNNSWGIAIRAAYGIETVNNSIIDCTIGNNSYHGIEISRSSVNYVAKKTTVTGCSIYGSARPGYTYGAGIYLWGFSDNIITNNNIYDNNVLGIQIRESPNNVLKNNILNGNLYSFYMQATSNIGDFEQDIDPTNMIDGKHIYYLKDHHGDILDGSKNIGYLALVSCTNILVTDADICGMVLVNTTGSTISNVDAHNSMDGIWIFGSSGNIIVGCDVYDNADHGIHLWGSSTNDIINCNTYNNGDYGIFMEYSSSNNNIESCDSYNNKYGIHFSSSSTSANTITDCNIYDNNKYGIYIYRNCNNHVITNCNVYHNYEYGIYLYGNYNTVTECKVYDNAQASTSRYGIYLYGNYNKLYHNSLANNNPNARDKKTTNTWDNGYSDPYNATTDGGNYWSDYTGVDLFHGPGQDILGPDGIGDTPYYPVTYGKDNYPLMLPWKDITHPVIEDVALTTSDPLDTIAPYGWEKVTCTVIDFEVDEVKLFVTDPGSITTEYSMVKIGYKYYSCEITLTDAGDYTYQIWANDTSNNIAVPTLPETFLLPANWEMNDDRFCDISDLRKVALQFGATGVAGWIRADYNNDGICDISDLRKVALHFGDTY